jgi:hypothetical protein
MGIDLKVLASHFRERQSEVLSTAMIQFERDDRLRSLFLREANPCIIEPLPAGLKVGHYEDEGLRFDDKDRYGHALTFTTPEKLKAESLLENQTEWNQATLKFLRALPRGSRIVLYWC